MIDLAEVGIENVNWIHLAENRDQWRAFVNVALNFQVPEAMQLVNYLVGVKRR